MKNNQLLVLALVALLFGGAGFFGGTTYQKSQVSALRGGNGAAFAGRTGGPGQTGTRRMGGQVMGDIISADSNSVTVKLADGSSKIALITNNTSIVNSVSATTTDLKVGARVAVFGATNTDGSVTAQSVQLNPMIRTATSTPSAQPTK